MGGRAFWYRCPLRYRDTRTAHVYYLPPHAAHTRHSPLPLPLLPRAFTPHWPTHHLPLVAIRVIPPPVYPTLPTHASVQFAYYLTFPYHPGCLVAV